MFDGLHEGHQGLLAIAKKDAEARKVPLVAVTFLPDPVEVLFDGSPQRLLSGKDRLRALAAWGVDGILVHHFTREFAALSGTQYVESKLLPCVPAVSVHVGSDFGLGAQGAEGSALLSSLGRQHGFEVHAHELFCSGGEKISATRIRNLLGQGRVEVFLLQTLHLTCVIVFLKMACMRVMLFMVQQHGLLRLMWEKPLHLNLKQDLCLRLIF